MTEEQKLDLVNAAIHARHLADALNVAYWTTDNGAVFDMQMKDAHREFAELAELLGYEVVKK